MWNHFRHFLIDSDTKHIPRTNTLSVHCSSVNPFLMECCVIFIHACKSVGSIFIQFSSRLLWISFSVLEWLLSGFFFSGNIILLINVGMQHQFWSIPQPSRWSCNTLLAMVAFHYMHTPHTHTLLLQNACCSSEGTHLLILYLFT